VKSFIIVTLLGFMISSSGNVFAQSCCPFSTSPKKEGQTTKASEVTPKTNEVIAGAEKEPEIASMEEATTPQS